MIRTISELLYELSSAVSSLSSSVAAKLTANAAITGGTKTKITYDSHGLITAGTDATTADIADSTDRRYVTEAEKSAIATIGGSGGGGSITLTGDVTGTGTGTFATTIAPGAVSLAKMANMATASVFYRKTAGTGAPEVQTLTTLKADLAISTADISGLGSLATLSSVTTGNITDAAVTLDKLADMPTATLIYRKTAGTGVPETQTLTTLKADLDLTGTNSGDQTTVSGNAGTATALQTPRTIALSGEVTGSASFDGSTDITIEATIPAGTVTVPDVLNLIGFNLGLPLHLTAARF